MKKTPIILITILLLSLCCCKESNKNWNATQTKTDYLNLTENTLWDDPVMQEPELDDFDSMVAKSADSLFYKKMMLFNEDHVSRPVAQKNYYQLKDRMKSKFSNYLGLYYLNDLLATLPEDNMHRDSIHYYLEEGYKWASGNNPVPLALFLVFWNNSMVLYSEIHCTDSVYKESQRLLKICKDQNIQLGIMGPYMALGHLLMEQQDFSTAALQYETVDRIACEEFPKLLGNGWDTLHLEQSELATTFLVNLGVHARCRAEAHDTAWIRNNLDRLNKYLRFSKAETPKNNIYSSLLLYYTLIGDEQKYEETRKAAEKLLTTSKIYERSKTDGTAYNMLTLHRTEEVYHHLYKGEANEAMKIMKGMPKFFIEGGTPQYAEACYMTGDYKKSAKIYSDLYSHSNGILNGKNLNTLQSLSARIDSESKEMEMMRSELKHERTVVIFSILLAVSAIAILITILFFYNTKRKQNRRLKEAFNAAEKANKAKDIFLKNITHETHTPLNHIYGFAQLLADRTMPIDEETTREMADAICSGSKQLTGILDNVVEVTDKLTKLDKLEDVPSILSINDLSES